MSCHSDRIVRITYPKNCCPEVDDSQQLLYNGPALACIDVQTNQTLNDAIKEIDTLLCNAQNSLIECCNTTTTTSSSTSTSTTTSTTTINPTICFNYIIEGGNNFSETISPGVSPALYNGKVWYGINGSDEIVVYWNNTEWVLDYNGLGGGGIVQTLDNNNNSLPISDSTYQWTPECADGGAGLEICSTTLGACP